MKKMLRRILVLTMAAFLCLSFLAGIAGAASDNLAIFSAAKAEDRGIMPCADIIGYRYKEEAGYLWRRLYNYSWGEWIGEWEICGILA